MSKKTSLTSDEISALAEFRSRVSDAYDHELADEKYLCWLRARDFNSDKAEQMFRRHLIWRANNEIDLLANWRGPKNYIPSIYLGLDFDGAPVFLLPFGRWDLRSVIEQGDMLQTIRQLYKLFETMITTANSLNKYQATIICDYDGFTYRQLNHRTVVQGIIETLSVLESNYPELLKHAFFINAPKILNLLMTLVRPILHSRTLAKLQIYNDDRTSWSNVLLKHMPASIVPPFWGGTRAGSDEFCSEAWNHEPLPLNYMKKLYSSFDEFGEEWITMKVNARDTLALAYTLEAGRDEAEAEEGSLLKWGFYTDNYDIGFSLAYQGNSGGEEELVSLSRFASHATSKCVDSRQVRKPGKYIIKFDNSYSRSRAKCVHYRISLTSVKKLKRNNVVGIHPNGRENSSNAVTLGKSLNRLNIGGEGADGAETINRSG